MTVITINAIFTNPAVISTLGVIIVTSLTLLTKTYLDKRYILIKLNAEHIFEQRKEIKKTISGRKVHLLTACDDLRHRLNNFWEKGRPEWIDDAKGQYTEETYYLHSFTYRLLCIFAWINILNKDLTFLDTTISTKEDLQLIKYLVFFPQIFTDLALIDGPNADGSVPENHFLKTQFEVLPNSICKDNGIKSYAEFLADVKSGEIDVKKLFKFFEGTSKIQNGYEGNQKKKRGRLYLMQITVIAFLNNYGYDFMQTDPGSIEKILLNEEGSIYLDRYFNLLKDAKLYETSQFVQIRKLAEKHGLINC